LAPGKRGLQRGLKGRQRTVILFLDETILTETPPLRAAWALEGEQAEVPITGNRDKRVLYGVLNPKTGTGLLHGAEVWNQEEFQGVLYQIRSRWRGWRIVLFIDRGSPHTAKRSRQLARELGIEIRWLPVACPELNPLEDLWRHVKQDVLANEPTPDLDASLGRALEYILSLTPKERLLKAGVLSGNFWLRNVL
jgi:transposase